MSKSNSTNSENNTTKTENAHDVNQHPIDTSNLKEVELDFRYRTISQQYAELLNAIKSQKHIKLQIVIESRQERQSLKEFLDLVKASTYKDDITNKIVRIKIIGIASSEARKEDHNAEDIYTLAEGEIEKHYKYDKTGLEKTIQTRAKRTKEAEIRTPMREFNQEINNLYKYTDNFLKNNNLNNNEDIIKRLQSGETLRKWLTTFKQKVQEHGVEINKNNDSEMETYFQNARKIVINKIRPLRQKKTNDFIKPYTLTIALNKETIQNLHTGFPNVTEFEICRCNFDSNTIGELRNFEKLQSLEIFDSIEWNINKDKTATPTYTLHNLKQLHSLTNLTHKFSYNDGMQFGQEPQWRALGRYNQQQSKTFFKNELSQLNNLRSLTTSNIWDLPIPLHEYKILKLLKNLNLTGQDYRFLGNEQKNQNQNSTNNDQKSANTAIYLNDLIQPDSKKFTENLQNIENFNFNILTDQDKTLDCGEKIKKVNLENIQNMFLKNQDIRFDGIHFTNNLPEVLEKQENIKTLHFSSTMLDEVSKDTNKSNSLSTNATVIEAITNTINKQQEEKELHENSKITNARILSSILSKYKHTLSEITITTPKTLNISEKKSLFGNFHIISQRDSSKNNSGIDFDKLTKNLAVQRNENENENNNNKTQKLSTSGQTNDYLTQLKKLQIASKDLTHNFIDFVLGNAPKLEILIVKPYISVYDEDKGTLQASKISQNLHDNAAQLKGLRHVDLTVGEKAQDKTFDITCLQYYPNLETIKLKDCEINFEKLEATLLKLPKLKKLEVSMFGLKEDKRAIKPSTLKMIKLKNSSLDIELLGVDVVKGSKKVSCYKAIESIDAIISNFHLFNELEANEKFKNTLLATHSKHPTFDLTGFNIKTIDINTLEITLDNEKQDLEGIKNNLREKCDSVIDLFRTTEIASYSVLQELESAANLIDKLQLCKETPSTQKKHDDNNNNENLIKENNDKRNQTEIEKELSYFNSNDNNVLEANPNTYLGLLLLCTKSITEDSCAELLDITKDDIDLYNKSLPTTVPTHPDNNEPPHSHMNNTYIKEHHKEENYTIFE